MIKRRRIDIKRKTVLISVPFFSLKSALGVMRVQNLVGEMAAGLFEIFVINLLYGEILMRFAERKIFVGVVEDRCSLGFEIDRSLDRRALYRLTAAVYASAGARHDFDEIDFKLAGFHLVQKLTGILCAGGYRDTNLGVAELIGRRLTTQTLTSMPLTV